jgi:hypothetical protein
MEAPVNFQVITKIDAAKRQLDVAIRLFFERKDLIAVHTLTAAARGVLRDVARPRHIKGIDRAIEKLSPKRKREFYKALTEAQNFFKHADKDPNPSAELKFYYETTPFLILDAVTLHKLLGAGLSAEMTAFVSWYIAKYPSIVIPGDAGLDAAVEASKGINVDDFDRFLQAIDYLKARQEKV